MTPSQIRLSRQLAASPEWQWADGMRNQHRERYDASRRVFVGSPDVSRGGWGVECRRPSPDDIPDLADPATVGCVEKLARMAWAPHDVWTRPSLYRGRRTVGVYMRTVDDSVPIKTPAAPKPTHGEAWAVLVLAASKR